MSVVHSLTSYVGYSVQDSQAESSPQNKKESSYEASDIDANHNSPGRVTPTVINATRRRKRSRGKLVTVSGDLGAGDKWFVTAADKPFMSAAVEYLVVAVR